MLREPSDMQLIKNAVLIRDLRASVILPVKRILCAVAAKRRGNFFAPFLIAADSARPRVCNHFFATVKIIFILLRIQPDQLHAADFSDSVFFPKCQPSGRTASSGIQKDPALFAAFQHCCEIDAAIRIFRPPQRIRFSFFHSDLFCFFHVPVPAF